MPRRRAAWVLTAAVLALPVYRYGAAIAGDGFSDSGLLAGTIFSVVIVVVLIAVFAPSCYVALGKDPVRARSVAFIVVSVALAHLVAGFGVRLTDSVWLFLAYPGFGALAWLAAQKDGQYNRT
jgi:hypothetical protein